MNESYFESIFAIFDEKSHFWFILDTGQLLGTFHIRLVSIIFWQNPNIELNQIGYRPALLHVQRELCIPARGFLTMRNECVIDGGGGSNFSFQILSECLIFSGIWLKF